MIVAALIGVAAGVASGLLGIGGGILLVPALTIVLGDGQVEAEATSLLAIVPVALVGSWRQRRYGNLRVHDAAVMGVLSIAGVLAGVALANALPERALRIGFALLLLNMARQLVRRGVSGRRRRLAA
ncbi:MAG TPA: TSUP family transporter [Conexibacter sp.]